MNALPVDDLLTPLSGDAPAGPNLEHDPQFMALESMARGVPERQAGSQVLPAEPPFWPDVKREALALAARTRDLRLAVLLARAAAHVDGVRGYADGLALLAGALDRHWDHVYPQLDADDGNDPTERLNALAPLTDFQTGLSDLRACAIGPASAGLTVRLLELAWGRGEAFPGEVRPTVDGVVAGLAQAAKRMPSLAVTLQSIDDSARAIEAGIQRRVGPVGPDLRPLLAITACCAAAAGQLAAPDAEAEAPTGSIPWLEGHPTGPTGRTSRAEAPGSRDDVVRVLELACDWLERHEPSNPAPLLIRRAQRLMSKSFIELVRDLAPDGLTQIERIAGVSESS